LINKTFKQLNAERAARRAPATGHKNFFWPTIPIKKTKKNKPSSSQAGGPAPKESGFKPPSFPDSCNNLFDREVDK